MSGAQFHWALPDLRGCLLLHHISRYSPSPPAHTWCASERVEVHAHHSMAFVKEHSFDHSIMESHTLAWEGSISTHPFSCLLPHLQVLTYPSPSPQSIDTVDSQFFDESSSRRTPPSLALVLWMCVCDTDPPPPDMRVMCSRSPRLVLCLFAVCGPGHPPPPPPDVGRLMEGCPRIGLMTGREWLVATQERQGVLKNHCLICPPPPSASPDEDHFTMFYNAGRFCEHEPPALGRG